MYVPPVMVPPPETRSVFIPQPPAPGTDILEGPLALPIPNITIHRIQPESAMHPVPQQGDLRNYLAEKRNTRSKDTYDPTEELGHQYDDRNSDRPVSPKEINRIENYIREKERQIQNRLHLLDKQLIDVGGSSSRPTRRSRERSVSPSDRKAHNRIQEIRAEKVNVTRQLSLLRNKGDRESREFTALCERQSALDRECTDIQRQLEAKKLWLAERARSLSRERHDQEQAKNPPTKRSPSRERRSRSSSRGARRRFSRSRSREYRARYNRYRRSRSRNRRSHSSDRHRRDRSSSRDRTSRRRSRSVERGRRYNRPSEANIKSPESLLHEMRQLGRPREGKSDQCGKLLECKDFQKQNRDIFPNREHNVSVFVGNVASGVREEELKATFARYGRIVLCDFSFLEKYGEVYIDYHQREDAFRALEMNRVKINGKRLRVALNCRKPANRDGYSVIVEMSERKYLAVA